MNYNIPLTRVSIISSVLTSNTEDQTTVPAYWYGVSLIPGRVIGCHVMLNNGANWARLPITALRGNDVEEAGPDVAPKAAQIYDCFGYTGNVVQYEFLRGQVAKFIDDKEIEAAWYLFTIDYEAGGPFSEDPEQHKQHHVFECSDGTIRARPNNFIRWVDPALYTPFSEPPKYRRINKIWSAEE